MVEAVDEAAEIADAVTVGVGERTRIHLVEHARSPPGSFGDESMGPSARCR